MSLKKYLKEKIKKIILISKYKKYKKYCKKNNQKEYLIFNTPIHGNIGDHAIIYAEYKLLENNKERTQILF
jgi:exopolysaccharide biosynthesis predicted pyruvyltransferase EpsI